MTLKNNNNNNNNKLLLNKIKFSSFLINILRILNTYVVLAINVYVIHKLSLILTYNYEKKKSLTKYQGIVVRNIFLLLVRYLIIRVVEKLVKKSAFLWTFYFFFVFTIIKVLECKKNCMA